MKKVLALSVMLVYVLSGCGFGNIHDNGDAISNTNTITSIEASISSSIFSATDYIQNTLENDEMTQQIVPVDNERVCRDFHEVDEAYNGFDCLCLYSIDDKFDEIIIDETKHDVSFNIHMKLRYPSIAIDYDEVANFDKTNYMLRYIAYKIVGDSHYPDSRLQSFHLEVDFDEILDWGWPSYQNTWETNYEVFNSTSDLISVLYRFKIGSTMRIISNIALVTIDICTGEPITLGMLFNEERIETIIREGGYELIEGNYLPGGIALDSAETHNGIANSFRNSPGARSVEIYQPGEHELYNPYDSSNFCIDDDYIYIWAYFYNSLNGYVLIRIPIDDLVELEKQ